MLGGREVSELGERVDNLECTVTARLEDQEMMWRQMAALEEQCIDLQAKQEDLENRSHCNNIRIIGGAENVDIMKFTMELFQTIQDEEDTPHLSSTGRMEWPLRLGA
ncbi:hypothetical protein NDU88_010274 [Pleurodeles waltl]|uniref:Uncharacterized protein n=1 Tax=Pleurodeles waltl TaxID=8319 RepID=A0AAV7PYC7_PLEWA|nr:hypothetical protein NDU88_010274 [Pleurodeles waltl]